MCTSLRNFCCRQLQKKQNIFDPPWLFFFFSFFATLPDFVGFTFTSFKYDWKEFWSQPKHACKWQLQSTLHCITVPNMTLKVISNYIVTFSVKNSILRRSVLGAIILHEIDLFLGPLKYTSFLKVTSTFWWFF